MNVDQFWTFVDSSAGANECWPWTGMTNGSGRGRIYWDGRSQYVYRIAWELTHGAPIPRHLLARHKCDNPICANPNHIEPGTHRDNARDMDERGRRVTRPRYGMDHHMAVFTPDQIRAVVAEWMNSSERQEDVAARHGISQSLLSTWARGACRPDSGIAPVDDFLKLKPCGTHAAYARHLRRGEKPCDECRAAESEHCAIYRAKRKAKEAA